MSKKIIILSVVITIIAVAGILWWQNKSMPVAKYSGPVEKIRLVVSKYGPDLSALILIADVNGYFKQQRLDVATTQKDTGVIAQREVAAGNADIATNSDFGFVGDSFTLSNLRILASIDHAKIVDIIARRDSGINNPYDLKGKKIGVPFGVVPEFFLNQFLISNGMLPSDVNIINTPVTDIQDAIISGKVDAVSIIAPASYSVKVALGQNAIFWSAQGDQSFSWLVISSDQFLAAHPQAAQRFIQSLLMAENFVKNYPEESKKIIEDKFTLSQEYFNQIWPSHQFIVNLSQSLLISMENEARWIIANKPTDQTKVPNYLNFIYFDALAKVNPGAVTIIH